MNNATALDAITDTSVLEGTVGALTTLSAAVKAVGCTFAGSDDPLIVGLVGYLAEGEDALGRAQVRLIDGMDRSRRMSLPPRPSPTTTLRH